MIGSMGTPAPEFTRTEREALAALVKATGPVAVMDVTAETWPRTVATDSPYATWGDVCSPGCGSRRETCRNGCGIPILYVPAHSHGPRYILGGWWHEDGRALCKTGPDVLPHCAAPLPKCPGCGSGAWVATDTAWGVASDCGDCGRHDYMSIGD